MNQTPWPSKRLMMEFNASARKIKVTKGEKNDPKWINWILSAKGKYPHHTITKMDPF